MSEIGHAPVEIELLNQQKSVQTDDKNRRDRTNTVWLNSRIFPETV